MSVRAFFLTALLAISQLALADYPVTGTLYPLMTTNISAQVGGRVMEVMVNVGDFVEKDQVLLKLDPFVYENEHKKFLLAGELAKVSFEEAELEYRRMKNLWENPTGEGSAISKKQHDDALTRFKQKKLQLDCALVDLEHSNRKLEEACVKAPYRGVITKRFVDPGEAVTTTPIVNLFEIVDASKLIFEFALPQEMADLTSPGLSISDEEGSVIGRIETIIPQIDPSNRSFRCRMVMDNGALKHKPGAYFTAQLQTP